jgi:hypothetical protein
MERWVGFGVVADTLINYGKERIKSYVAWRRKNFPRATGGSTNAHSGKSPDHPAKPWGRSKRHFCAEKKLVRTFCSKYSLFFGGKQPRNLLA